MMIPKNKNVHQLVWGEECDTYLTHVCKYPCTSKDQDKNIKTRSFQPTQWLSSAVEVDFSPTSTADESHSVG